MSDRDLKVCESSGCINTTFEVHYGPDGDVFDLVCAECRHAQPVE